MRARSSSNVVVDLHPAVLERARAGDLEAFAAIVGRYDESLRALAYRLLGDRDRMDDALQQAYLKAFRALPRFRGESAFGTWLYRIAYNSCLEELERSRRDAVVPLDELPERAAAGADLAESTALRQELADALAQLPAADRAAVLMVDAQGFDYASAAKVLGIPPGTIASRLNRARRALRRVLDHPREGAGER